MKKRLYLSSALLLAVGLGATAQRSTDVLDRGLVAVKTADGVFCSWRIPAEEWYGVKYNIYRDGTKLNASPLEVSNFTDTSGSEAATYTVTAVVDGVEQAQCPGIKALEKNYMTITPKHNASLTATYVPNDACCADVDGDGILEILMKYDNQTEIEQSYPYAGANGNGEYSLFECLKLDGTVLWWVNCGPNMGDFQNNEQNIVGYDWDRDGRAEVVFRAADGTTIHMADGTVYTVGDSSVNYRGTTNGGTNWFMHSGKEYLLYVDGLTGKPYQCIEYPLKRVEDADNPNGLLYGSAYDSLVNAYWGDGYGHRSTKHFFGAPYLDGRNPSIFLARGIYTHHKMIAYDVNPATHELIERWRWNDIGDSWYGQGYHNYSIADVDWDGRDEIVFGSMVIDDNGKGLSTCGLGHGDSHHVGDFDPYTRGQEVFACNEDSPNNNLRDATTSKIYYRTTGGNDDGRAMCGKFIDEYPGAQAISSRDDALIGGASHKAIVGDSKSTVTITQNFRIYWDGDLLDESFDYSNGKNSAGAIYDARKGRIALLEGSKTNNDTKGTPCYQGDIFGDWREEVIMRDGNNNIRIYTTDIPTAWRIYSLWHDPQYRNAMVWQMCGYNQTPHVSYYLGAAEGITVPPAPNTMTGRTEIADGATIGADVSGKHVILCQTTDMTVYAAAGAAPKVLTVNAPSWTQGNNSNNKITTERFTHTLKGGPLSGDMCLVKQGEGILNMPEVAHTYSGTTEVWGGELALDGALTNSHVWVNRLASLTVTNGSLPKGIDLHYASNLNIGTEAAPGTLVTGTLSLGFGSVINIDLFADGTSADKITAESLVIETKDWLNGPEYSAPVLRLAAHPLADAETLEPGKYLIGEIGEIKGNITDLVIEGITNQKVTLIYEDGKLYAEIKKFEAGIKTWAGTENGLWDVDNTLAFVADGSDIKTAFVPGDELTFDDSAENTDVIIDGNVMPGSVTFRNDTKDYTLSGSGSIVGETSLTKEGAATLTVNNINQYTGNTYINAGKLVAASFANTVGSDLGALSSVASRIYISDNAVLAPAATATVGNRITLSKGNGTIEVPAGVTMTLQYGVGSSTPGQSLFKDGSGTLALAAGNGMSKLVILNGSVNASENSSSQVQAAATVEFVKGSLYDESNMYSYSTNSTSFIVEEGNSGALYLDSRCDYTGKLTGAGTLTVYAAGPRNYLKGNWSAFTGTVVANQLKRGSSYDPDFIWSNNYGLPKATLNIASGTTFNPENRSIELGNLSGTGIISTTGTITVGGNDNVFSFSGTYAGNPALVKVGEGDWKLVRAVSGPRSITVKGGTFSLAPSSVTTNVCTLPLTISGNALMRGRGAVSTVTVESGATIQPGYYSTSNDVHYGAITVSGDATVKDGALASFCIRKADNAVNSRSHLAVGGCLTINGIIEVTLYEYNPAIGDEIVLWTAGSFAGAPSEIRLPELPDGFGWDDSGLRDGSGNLRVVEAAAGISDIPADASVICRVYGLDGTYVGIVNTVRSEMISAIRRELKLAPGVYVVSIEASDKNVTIKINL